MCNQLISLSSIYSLGLEYMHDVKCPCIDRNLTNYFEFNSSYDGIHMDVSESDFSKQILVFVNLFNRVCKHHKQNLQMLKCDNNKTYYFTKWLESLDHTIFYKHIDAIREYFRFKEEVLDAIKVKFDSVNSNRYTTVGVHIRRGDYKSFHGGEWYYDDEQYSMLLSKFKNSIEKDILFYICSNEKIELDFYRKKGLNVVRVGNTSIEDLGILSLCDFIIGPPSTYSFWASMLGMNKRYIVEDIKKSFSILDFQTVDERLKKGEAIK